MHRRTRVAPFAARFAASTCVGIATGLLLVMAVSCVAPTSALAQAARRPGQEAPQRTVIDGRKKGRTTIYAAPVIQGRTAQRASAGISLRF